MWIGSKRSNAWLPGKISQKEFIVLGFENPTPVNQIIIAESENPGSIKSIFFYDEELYEYTQLDLEAAWVEDGTRFFHQKFEETPFAVHAIKLVLDVESVPGRNTIDAVGLGNSESSLINSIEKKALQDLRNFKTERMSESVNSQYEENDPILSPDGNTLYFSRQYDPLNVGGEDDPEDIWYSERIGDGNEWTPAKNLGPPWNTKGPNFICSITNINGVDHYLLGNIYEEKDKMREGVSIATIENGVYSPPEALQIENEYNYSNRTDYYLVNENTLIMATNRDGGFGNRDVYVSFKQGETWTEPKNLGPTINSFAEEGSPQMDLQAKVLYFSSKGFNGYGGFDVYVSQRLDDTWENWSEPLNLGMNVNGNGDESYFNVSENLVDRFYAKGDSAGTADIYHITQRPKMVLISGRVVDDENSAPVDGATVLYKDVNNDQFYSITNVNGDYQIFVPGGQTWMASAEMDGYVLVNTLEVELEYEDEMSVDLIRMKNVPPPPVVVQKPSLASFTDPKTGESFDYLTVLFDVNSSYLRGSHFGELQRLAKYLVANSELKVELHGHADSRSTEHYNKWLSERRANRVADYLSKYGVAADRIKVAAYGESELVNDCVDEADCSRAKHQENRRTEIRLIK